MQIIRHVQRPRPTTCIDLHTAFCALYISARGLSTTSTHRATGGSNDATPNPQHSATPEANRRTDVPPPNKAIQSPKTMPLNPPDKIAAAQKQISPSLSKSRAKPQEPPKQGGLAPTSIFADENLPTIKENVGAKRVEKTEETALAGRSVKQMAARLDPAPNARRRWQRKMVIRNVHRSGRPTREMLLARSERTHTSKSRFFKTSMKKLAPLARQIAGKSLDEAILQMRFSGKKAAAEVQKHLIQARNEAIVMRGMGMSAQGVGRPARPSRGKSSVSIQDRIMGAFEETKHATTTTTNPPPTKTSSGLPLTQSSAVFDRLGPEITTPAETVPLATQNPTKSVRKDIQPNETDIYIAQAWINRGQYGAQALYRARGRVDRLRLPYTGISVMLKEEKTRTREKAEKEMKAIKKRLSGKVWSQLPDRPIVRQSQYVLW